MNKNSLSLLKARLSSLVIFREILSDPIVKALYDYLDALDKAPNTACSAYCEFVSKLYEYGQGLLDTYLQNLVFNNENVYVKLVGEGKTPDGFMKEALDHELALLNELAMLSPEELKKPLGFDEFLPAFSSGGAEIKQSYIDRIKNIGRYGYGIYAQHYMFCLDDNGAIIPVKHPDKTKLSSLVDYERQQKIILDNTIALLEGKNAANILLTGDAGTGKSSTVKAVVNELRESGLRIIEVRKEQLTKIPALLDELAPNPLKFIVFIDDLSFTKSDDSFNALKAVLEGSVSSRSQNTVIYATSNRRHLIKESFSDRDGDDIHKNDTMQEIISLSLRFGIHITFERPDKNTYLDIVHHLAAEHGVKLDTDELDAMAERFALERGGRSARLARQMIDGLSAK